MLGFRRVPDRQKCADGFWEPRLLGLRERSLVPTGRTEGLIFGRASLELCPEMRGRPQGSGFGLQAAGQAEAEAINTSSDWARTQRSSRGPWCCNPQKVIITSVPES